MKVGKFSEVKVIRNEIFRDSRGSFQRICSFLDFKLEDQMGEILEVSFSHNPNPLTLRGLHAMPENSGEIKYVSCVSGKVLDVIVDIRKGSNTFLDHMAIVLGADTIDSVLIPPGFAHGYLTLDENSSIVYAMGARYDKDLEFGLRWNDPSIDIEWGIKQPQFISIRDQNFELLYKEA